MWYCKCYKWKIFGFMQIFNTNKIQSDAENQVQLTGEIGSLSRERTYTVQEFLFQILNFLKETRYDKIVIFETFLIKFEKILKVPNLLLFFIITKHP